MAQMQPATFDTPDSAASLALARPVATHRVRVPLWIVLLLRNPKGRAGLVFIEYVFSYPGAGLTLQQAALGNDYPLTQGLLLIFALTVIAANIVMDLLNLVLDPRVRTG